MKAPNRHVEAGELSGRAPSASIEPESAAAENEIEALKRELFETNQGVLALYAELDDKNGQLRHVSELKSRFLSYVSHEFRSPLTAIQSLARLLIDRLDGPLTPEQERQVRLIMTAANELSEMVEDQLDLAKVEAGRITISPAWFEMVDLFAALRGIFRPLLLHEGVTLTFEDPLDMPRVYSDDKKLAQILRNLISNALKFTQRGEVRISAQRSGESEVRFCVEDTGIGIPEDLLPTIFQDFVQLDSPLQRQLRGTGLGLALCKRFAELLGGCVTVESRVGVGSKFFVTIPIQLTEPAAGAAMTPAQ